MHMKVVLKLVTKCFFLSDVSFRERSRQFGAVFGIAE